MTFFRQTKVSQLDMTLFIKHDVFRFDVAINNVLIVKILET